jgi:hypothetical protein
MPTKNATQNFVPIADIRDGVVILKSGQMCSILLASSINFALKSTTEQQAILSQFQAFLNTLDFSLQIYVQSRKLDIRPYMDILRAREPSQDNDLMKIQLREYMEFIQTFTTEVDIMSKNFFVVVPYTPNAIDMKGIRSIGGIKGLISSARRKETKFDATRFAEDRSQLEQRLAVVEQGLARIGVRTALLGNEELTELYYHIFNPEDMSKAPLR